MSADDDALVRAIELVAGEITNVRSGEPRTLLRVLVSNGFNIVEKAEAALARHPATLLLDESALVIGKMSSALSRKAVAKEIVARVWRGDNVSQTVILLLNSLGNKSVRSASCLGIAGIDLDREVPLVDGVRLVPPAYFPSGAGLNNVFKG